MILGQSAGVAAAMLVREFDMEGDAPQTAQNLNVTALRARLRALGQYIEPAPPPPQPGPPPSPNPPLTGFNWFAWKPMWTLGSHNASITATKDHAVLKREYTNSGHLPPSEDRFFSLGTTVPLRHGPGAVRQASKSD